MNEYLVKANYLYGRCAGLTRSTTAHSSHSRTKHEAEDRVTTVIVTVRVVGCGTATALATSSSEDREEKNILSLSIFSCVSPRR